nr:M23 family metallopeptidase [Paenibacillus sp. BIHB 4019]
MKQTVRFAAALTLSACLLTGHSGQVLAAARPAEHQDESLLPVHSAQTTPKAAEVFATRQTLYDKLSLMTGISWPQLAAIDQYERTLSSARPKTRPLLGQTVGVFIEEDQWSGLLNPNKADVSPLSIRWFNGIGRDGDGDGQAERNNDFDLLYAIASKILQHGTTEDDLAIGLWEYYHNSRSVQRIQQFTRIYETFGRLDLFEHAFPLPVGNNYSYKSTWGNARSWGGRRSHEGTDLFAGHGLSVKSTCYGIVEVKGWNPFGGWRIGIRDLNNYYHYYAHLSGFDKSLAAGTVVKPGQVIGWVGSSGYGKPGTQGKFPPHLHYGIYRDRGLIEWSFDPYPLLKAWEREELRRMKKG